MDPKPFLLFCSLAAGDYFSGPRNDPRFREANFIPANRLEYQAGRCIVEGIAYSLIKNKKQRKILKILAISTGIGATTWNGIQRRKVK